MAAVFGIISRSDIGNEASWRNQSDKYDAINAV